MTDFRTGAKTHAAFSDVALIADLVKVDAKRIPLGVLVEVVTPTHHALALRGAKSLDDAQKNALGPLSRRMMENLVEALEEDFKRAWTFAREHAQEMNYKAGDALAFLGSRAIHGNVQFSAPEMVAEAIALDQMADGAFERWAQDSLKRRWDALVQKSDPDAHHTSSRGPFLRAIWGAPSEPPPRRDQVRLVKYVFEERRVAAAA